MALLTTFPSLLPCICTTSMDTLRSTSFSCEGSGFAVHVCTFCRPREAYDLGHVFVRSLGNTFTVAIVYDEHIAQLCPNTRKRGQGYHHPQMSRAYQRKTHIHLLGTTSRQDPASLCLMIWPSLQPRKSKNRPEEGHVTNGGQRWSGYREDNRMQLCQRTRSSLATEANRGLLLFSSDVVN
jgi:hypothetical protein